jgi:hypothetical protein
MRFFLADRTDPQSEKIPCAIPGDNRHGAEFFNNIGTKRTRRGGLTMSVHWGKAELVPSPGEVAF